MSEKQTIVKKPDTSAKTRKKAFAREYVANGFNASKAAIKVKPGMTPGGARVRGSRYLADAAVQAEINKHILSPEEIKEHATHLALNGKAETTQVRALELLARIHAMLTERNITELYQHVTEEELVKRAEQAVAALLASPQTLSPAKLETGQPCEIESESAHGETGPESDMPKTS